MEIDVLLIGDIVGKPGRSIVKELIPSYIEENKIELVIANGENAAQGTGITENLFKELVATGIDVVTTGDHTWRRREILNVLQNDRRILRPQNYSPEAVGRGYRVFETRRGIRVGVVTVLGRIFMEPVDCPFRTAEAAVQELKAETPVCFLEIHAEATSEKVAMGWKFAGQVSCVFGTHTHVTTADERVIPGGTAYITDLGMTGPHDSVIGRDKENVIYKFRTNMHAPFHVATGDVRLSGAKVRVDVTTGKALAIERVRLTQDGASLES